MGIMLTIGGMHIHDDVFERCGHFLIVFAGASSMYAMVNYYLRLKKLLRQDGQGYHDQFAPSVVVVALVVVTITLMLPSSTSHDL